MPGSDNQNISPDDMDAGVRPLIRIEDVSKRFGPLSAVSNATFNVYGETILGLVGSDGAGKTTLLRMIATMIKPSAGRIFIDDLDVVTRRKAVKGRIGYMPQRFGLYHDLTVGENIDFFMDIFGIFGAERKKRREYYLGFSNLLPFVDRPAGDLSGGMKQKLGLACVLVHQPMVLILDEPTNGVDPVSRKEFWEILAGMKQEGMTILVSTAYLEEGEKCDRLILMHRSEILAEASPKEFKSDFIDLEAAVIHRIEAKDKLLTHEGFKL